MINPPPSLLSDSLLRSPGVIRRVAFLENERVQPGLTDEDKDIQRLDDDRDAAPALSPSDTSRAVARQNEDLDLPFGKWAVQFFVFRLPVYLLLIFELYVLSIGPLYFKWYESFAMHETQEQAIGECGAIGLFYYPLLALCHYCPRFGDLVNWYLHTFWV